MKKPNKNTWTEGTYQVGLFLRTPAGTKIEAMVDDLPDEHPIVHHTSMALGHALVPEDMPKRYVTRANFLDRLRIALKPSGIEVLTTSLGRDGETPMWVICVKWPRGTIQTLHAHVPEGEADAMKTVSDVTERICKYHTTKLEPAYEPPHRPEKPSRRPARNPRLAKSR